MPNNRSMESFLEFMDTHTHTYTHAHTHKHRNATRCLDIREVHVRTYVFFGEMSSQDGGGCFRYLLPRPPRSLKNAVAAVFRNSTVRMYVYTLSPLHLPTRSSMQSDKGLS